MSACVLGWSARETLCGWAGARVLMLLKRFQTVRDETLFPSGRLDPLAGRRVWLPVAFWQYIAGVWCPFQHRVPSQK